MRQRVCIVKTTEVSFRGMMNRDGGGFSRKQEKHMAMTTYSRQSSGNSPVVPPEADQLDAPVHDQPPRPKNGYDTCCIRNIDVVFLVLGLVNPLMLCILVCGRGCNIFPIRTWVFVVALILVFIVTTLIVSTQLAVMMVDEMLKRGRL